MWKRRLLTTLILAGLIGMGFRNPPSEYAEPLELAKQLYRARAALNADDADQDMAAGRFFMAIADPASANRRLIPVRIGDTRGAEPFADRAVLDLMLDLDRQRPWAEVVVELEGVVRRGAVEG